MKESQCSLHVSRTVFYKCLSVADNGKNVVVVAIPVL